LSPFSFFNVFSANPPILVFSPARRGRDNTTKHTFENVEETKEAVINIVNHAMVEQMSLSSTEYGDDVNEFVKAGFRQVPSETVKPPRVGEAPISFECTVDKVIALGNEGGAGNLVISRITRIHLNTAYQNEQGKLDTKKLDLVARMGESWYCRASGEALFEIPKPIFNKGIGVDQLPKHLLQSTILTGNHLGRLGNMEELPTREAIVACQNNAAILTILNLTDETEKRTQLHKYAMPFLEKNDLEQALCILSCLD